MAQFDVYRNNNPKTQKAVPYLLDVQADVLAALATRVVVPLVTLSAMGKPAKDLNPQFKIRRTAVVMSTAQLAGIDKQDLGAKVASLKEQRETVLAAVDFLLSGF